MNRSPYSNVTRPRNRCPVEDPKEWMKKEMTRQGNDAESGYRFGAMGVFGGGGGSAATGGGASGDTGFEDVELYFDSFRKNDADSLLSNGTLSYSVASMNNNLDLRNVVQMHITPFFFPRIEGDTARPDYFFYRKLYIYVQSLSSTNAVHASLSNHFHWEFDVDNLNSVAVELTPAKPDFYFPVPLNALSNITFQFLRPKAFNAVDIPNDSVRVRSVAGSNPGQFVLLNGDLTTTVFGPVGIPTSPGYAVEVTGFASSDATINTDMNDVEGNYVTEILTTTTFSMSAFNFAALVADYEADMYVMKNRIAFSVRFTCIKTQSTNYITPTHV
jgi:hypothetical protein